MNKMNKERQKSILEILVKKRKATVKELAAAVFASEPSIRRDLATLENQRLVRRVHGGAVLEETGISRLKIPFVIREYEESNAKQVIAQKAAELVSDGNVVFLDASSTAFNIVPFLVVKKDLTVITSGLKALNVLSEYGIKTISTGGELLGECQSFVGNSALKTIDGYYADVAFFSCRGVTLQGEMSDISVEEDIVRQHIICRSARAYAVIASHKIGKQYYHKLGDLSEIDGIISECPLPEPIKKFQILI